MVARQVERGDRGVELVDRIVLPLGPQLTAHGSPDVLLGLAVVDVRVRLTGLPGQRCGSDLVAPRAVGRIVCARMVVRQMDLYRAVLAGGHG